MLEVGDRTHYKMLKGRTLKSAYRFSKYQWDCILRGGKLLQIRFKTGILGMTIGESEYELGDEIMLVGMDNDWKESELSDSPFDDMDKGDEDDEEMDEDDGWDDGDYDFLDPPK